MKIASAQVPERPANEMAPHVLGYSRNGVRRMQSRDFLSDKTTPAADLYPVLGSRESAASRQSGPCGEMRGL